MRILLLNQFFYPDSGATSQLLTDLPRGLAAEGHSVRAICGRSSYAYVEPDSLNPPAVEIIRTPDIPFGRGLVARTFSYTSFLTGALYRGLLGPRPDLILTLTTPPRSASSVVSSRPSSVPATSSGKWTSIPISPSISVSFTPAPGVPASWALLSTTPVVRRMALSPSANACASV